MNWTKNHTAGVTRRICAMRTKVQTRPSTKAIAEPAAVAITVTTTPSASWGTVDEAKAQSQWKPLMLHLPTPRRGPVTAGRL